MRDPNQVDDMAVQDAGKLPEVAKRMVRRFLRYEVQPKAGTYRIYHRHAADRDAVTLADKAAVEAAIAKRARKAAKLRKDAA